MGLLARLAPVVANGRLGNIRISLHKQLDFAEVIADFDEGEFAEAADGGDAAGNGDGLAV